MDVILRQWVFQTRQTRRSEASLPACAGVERSPLRLQAPRAVAISYLRMRISSRRPVVRLLGWVLAPLFGGSALWLCTAQVFLLRPLFSAVLTRESPAIQRRFRWGWSV